MGKMVFKKGAVGMYSGSSNIGMTASKKSSPIIEITIAGIPALNDTK